MATIGEGLASFGRNFAAGRAQQATARQNRLMQEQQLDFKKRSLALQEKEINMRQQARDDVQATKDSATIAKRDEAIKFHGFMTQLEEKTGTEATSRLLQDDLSQTPSTLSFGAEGVDVQPGEMDQLMEPGSEDPFFRANLDSSDPAFSTFLTDDLSQFAGEMEMPEGVDPTVGAPEEVTTPAGEKMNLVERFGGAGAISKLEGLDEISTTLQEKVMDKASEMEVANSEETRIKREKAMVDFKKAKTEAVISEINANEALGNIGKLSDSDRARTSSIFNNQMTTRKDQAKPLDDRAVSVMNGVPMINELMDIASKLTLADYADVDKMSAWKADVAALKAFLVGDLRLPLVGPGALSQAELNILNNVVRDPTDVLSLKTGNMSALDSLRSKLVQGLRNQAEISGVKDLDNMIPSLQKAVDFTKNTVMMFDSVDQANAVNPQPGQRVIIAGQEGTWKR